MSSAARVLIIGVGRPGFGDDALGLVAARELEGRLAGVARVLVDGTGLAALAARERETLWVLVDAAESSAELPAGRWCRLCYPQDAAALTSSALRTTHTMPIADTLAMADALGCLPPEVWIYALAGECFVPETPLSDAVWAALPFLVEEIETDVRNWLAEQNRNS